MVHSKTSLCFTIWYAVVQTIGTFNSYWVLRYAFCTFMEAAVFPERNLRWRFDKIVFLLSIPLHCIVCFKSIKVRVFHVHYHLYDQFAPPPATPTKEAGKWLTIMCYCSIEWCIDILPSVCLLKQSEQGLVLCRTWCSYQSLGKREGLGIRLAYYGWNMFQ